jgi:hypothetical protein
LPHAHIVVWLKDRLLTSSDFDSIISAEFPDPEAFPQLHKIVLERMTHGPCGDLHPDVCSADRHTALQMECCRNKLTGQPQKCKNGFPAPFCDATTICTTTGSVTHKRRDTGQSWAKKQDVGSYRYTNADVVPYSPKLLLKYNSHICVLAVDTSHSLAYLHKYIHKGADMTLLRVVDGEEKAIHDENLSFLIARYLCCSEAVWRLYDFPVHQNLPAVTRLSVHLPTDRDYPKKSSRRYDPPPTSMTS